MKLSIVLGTRPEIIKACSLIRLCERLNLDYFILHTGQHYDHSMDGIFFEELSLPKPKFNLGIGSANQGKETALMLQHIGKILVSEKPNLVMVIGDTNTVLAAALAAKKLGIKVAHIEAGLRSYDREMAEEQNRVVTDHLSDYLFAPTEEAAEALRNEGLQNENIFVVGNTVVDAAYQNIEVAKTIKRDAISTYGLQRGKYVLATAHRPENVDNATRLKKIADGLVKINRYTGLSVLFSVHPRTKKNIVRHKIKIGNEIKMVGPLGYLEFLQLMTHASVIVTDSGGIQEESTILKIPCVTMRDNTERPESIKIGANNPWNRVNINLNLGTKLTSPG